MTAKPQVAALALLAAGIAAADIASKHWAVTTLKGEPPMEIAPFLRLVYVENTGAAFGILAGGGARWFLLAVGVGLCIALAMMIWRSQNPGERTAAAMIIGGAIGNMQDRYRLGYVVDFVDLHWGMHHWPAFNTADAAISCGALWFVWVILRGSNTPSP